MLNENQQPQPEKKRILKKVRTHYLQRRPEDENDSLIPVPKLLNPNTLCMIDGSAGLVEKNRKMFLGVRYLNSHLNISNIQIDDQYDSKRVVLNFGKLDPSKVISWEYCTKRLESYGDLDLATWAHKIRHFYERYPLLMRNYCQMVQSQDKETYKALENMRTDIRELQQKIESKYPYKRITIFYGREKKELVSISLNQSILKEIGQTPEEFACWAKVNGIPALFDGDSKIAYKLSKSYLDYFPWPKLDGIEEGPDIISYLIDKNGCKKKVVSQYVKVREPLPDGILISIYVLVKSNGTSCEEESEKDCQVDGAKCVKEDEKEGNPIEQDQRTEES